MTYEQAVSNQWSIANHRIAFAQEAEKKGSKDRSCPCKECQEHMAAMEQPPAEG